MSGDSTFKVRPRAGEGFRRAKSFLTSNAQSAMLHLVGKNFVCRGDDGLLNWAKKVEVRIIDVKFVEEK